MRAYFDALARDDAPSLYLAWIAMAHAERLLVMLCFGGIGLGQYGFRAEVGRA